MEPVFTYPITEQEDGSTVEALLLSRGYSRRLIIDLKKKPEYLTVGGSHVYVTKELHDGEVLRVQLPQEACSAQITPTPMDLEIVYEDDHLLVLNKPANTPIHPSQGNHSNTLANGMAWYFAAKGQPFVYRVINRLDRDTTGLLILARHALSACILSELVRTRQIHRTYLAAVDGDLRLAGENGTGVVDAPIARVDGSTIERQVDFSRGEPARTHYRFLSYQESLGISLAELKLETGRTHQIRVHMKYLGFPLLGDFLYNPDYRYIGRQSLHSWKLSFPHPITGEVLSFTARVPKDMQFFLP